MALFNRLFRRSNDAIHPDITQITRTEVIEGVSIPGIIHNVLYYSTDLQIYSDGLINCWEMVDLSMFKEKLKRGRVITSIPDGEAISIFNLGRWLIEQGEWEHTAETLFNFVKSLIKQLNPTLENLHNYNGSNTKKIGEVNVSKHFSPDAIPYYCHKDPNSFFPSIINGKKFPFFFRNDDRKTYLVDLSIYQSGYIEITNLPTKKVLNFDELDRYVDEGLLTTELEIGESIAILN